MHKFFQKEQTLPVNIHVKAPHIEVQMVHDQKQVTLPTKGSVSWIEMQSPDPLQPLKALKKAEGKTIFIYSEKKPLQKGTLLSIEFEPEKIILYLDSSEE